VGISNINTNQNGVWQDARRLKVSQSGGVLMEWFMIIAAGGTTVGIMYTASKS